MTLRNVRNAALVLAVVFMLVGFVMTATEEHHEKAEITIGEHVTRTVGGLTFNIDTIISHAGRRRPRAAPRLPGPSGADPEHRGPRPDQAPAALGDGRRARSTPRSRTTSARCTPTSRRWRSRCSSSSCSQLARAAADRAQPRRPPAAGADRGHQPHLRAGAADDGERLGLRHPTEGPEGLLQALRRAVPGPAPAQHPRGAHQADHAGAATLRQHLRRRHHAGADRA